MICQQVTENPELIGNRHVFLSTSRLPCLSELYTNFQTCVVTSYGSYQPCTKMVHLNDIKDLAGHLNKCVVTICCS